jgi:hypothetical protein
MNGIPSFQHGKNTKIEIMFRLGNLRRSRRYSDLRFRLNRAGDHCRGMLQIKYQPSETLQ